MIEHLQPAIWAEANRQLIEKALSEFAHERLIEPVLERVDAGWGCYVLQADQPGTRYRFRAKILPLDHWHIEAHSVNKTEYEEAAPLDTQMLVLDLKQSLRLKPELLPAYLQEIACTLYARAYKLAQKEPSARELAQTDFQTVERAMREGHPCFVANNARVGFDAVDHPRYAPEAAQPFPLIWLAGHRSQALFSCLPELQFSAFMEQELGADRIRGFEAQLRRRGLDPGDYVYLPVHPWQWTNTIAQQFAGDLAQGRLIHLGDSEDLYQPQQSIRTLFNSSQPRKHYVKTALNIRNMGFMRGLSPSRMLTTPGVNAWVKKLVESDPALVEYGFTILQEVATVGFRQTALEQSSGKIVDDAKEMLAALWRESPLNQVQPGQNLMTMAALLHRDNEGRSVLMELIRAAGVDTRTWVQHYLRAYLKPQLHCLYAHHLIFTPHGENVILVLEKGLPVRMIMKDIAEDIGVVNPESELPPSVKHLAIPVPEEIMTLSVFTDAFDCFFRFLVPVLMDDQAWTPEDFWQEVAACIRAYEREQPAFAEKFRRYDLFAPRFPLNCLNRLQLTNHEEMVDLNSPDPAQCLQFAGTLDNPIAGFQP